MAQKIDRAKVHKKYNGHCGYCGKVITIKEMQVDHMIPRWSAKDNIVHDFSNLMPACRRCNHYKRADNVEQFRISMKGLHKRLERIYINNVAVDFGMIDIKPFDGLFYFEKLRDFLAMISECPIIPLSSFVYKPMAQQTAVDWVIEQLCQLAHNPKTHIGMGDVRVTQGYLDELKEQAKQMEREQIIKAHKEGNKHNGWALRHEHEQYYNETYGNNTKTK